MGSIQHTQCYQILRVSERLHKKALRGLSGVVYVETDEHHSLVFADPDIASAAGSQLEYFGLRGMVLPDYVLAEVLKDCGTRGFSLSGISFSEDRALRSITKDLLDGGRREELYGLLKDLRIPIAALELEYEGFKVMLHGAGLVTITGLTAELPHRIEDILGRLTYCLIEAFDDSYSGVKSVNAKSFVKANVLTA